MSSNIKVQRICQHCGKEFEAKQTTTRFCSHTCNSRAYKNRIKDLKVEVSNKETVKAISKPIEELKAKDFLTVTQVSKLIGCSRQNVYKLINSGKLKATNILEKKTIIRRADIEKLFEQPETEQSIVGSAPAYFHIADSYNLSEVQSKFGISESALQQLIIRHNIPKIKNGWYAYVPKAIIDKLLGTTQKA